MLRVRKKYLIVTLLLFVAEILIALYARDRIIRPYGGDFLVVILLYCMVSSVTDFGVKITATTILLFSYLIEILQYYHIVKLSGLQNSKIANVVLGTSFEWADMLAYTLGIIFVVIFETK